VNHYNHFRPHQGLDGMVPADRFFGVEDEVRKVLEEMMEKNAIRLAIDETPRTPVFIIGQIGDQPLSLHGESGKLVLQTPNGIDEISYENFGHKKTILGDNYERTTNRKEEIIFLNHQKDMEVRPLIEGISLLIRFGKR
jgi:hypothetical protein